MKPGRRLVLLVALSVLTGFFAGRVYWSLRDLPQPAGGPPPSPAPAVAELPDLRLTDLGGTARSLREWSGEALLLNFWATWCAPCREEMPLLEQLHQERSGRGLAVVGVAIDREEPVRRFVAETGVSYPILLGETEAMAAAETFAPEFLGLPLTVIAAPGGGILKVKMGELHTEDLQAIVAVLDRLADGSITLAGARDLLKADGSLPGTVP
ncbi:MAG: TlpA family protein disulfide reductase [Gammaproteobacteria bacterium]|nr:TlpA family protein disulfide reductase [Gammaproteobacteria bacterium]